MFICLDNNLINLDNVKEIKTEYENNVYKIIFNYIDGTNYTIETKIMSTFWIKYSEIKMILKDNKILI